MVKSENTNPLVGEILREYEEDDRRARLRTLGVKSDPKISNFPEKGDDKVVAIRNSNYPEFPMDIAEKVRLRRDLWKLGGAESGMWFRLWKRAHDDDAAPVVARWIKKREKWAKKNIDKKLTPSLVIRLIKNGVIHKAGKTAMLRVLGLNSEGNILKGPRSGLKGVGESEE